MEIIELVKLITEAAKQEKAADITKPRLRDGPPGLGGVLREQGVHGGGQGGDGVFQVARRDHGGSVRRPIGVLSLHAKQRI